MVAQTQNVIEYKNDTVLGSLQSLKNTSSRLEQAVRSLIVETRDIRRGNKSYFEECAEGEEIAEVKEPFKEPLSNVAYEMHLIDYSIEKSLQAVFSLIADINLK